MRWICSVGVHVFCVPSCNAVKYAMESDVASGAGEVLVYHAGPASGPRSSYWSAKHIPIVHFE
jgi:hypothetical protein